MEFKIKKTKIPGCFELIPKIFKDLRGFFVKIYHQNVFENNDIEPNFVEEYYSFSLKGVLRGLHFQLPPMDHVKLVHCVWGKVFDAVVDLRIGSPTFGEFEIFELSAEKAHMIYIPKGIAHGFYVMSDSAIMMYKVTTIYSPEHDTGILWNSAGIPWPTEKPILSKRDTKFISLKDFKSPFIYQK